MELSGDNLNFEIGFEFDKAAADFNIEAKRVLKKRVEQRKNRDAEICLILLVDIQNLSWTYKLANSQKRSIVGVIATFNWFKW